MMMMMMSFLSSVSGLFPTFCVYSFLHLSLMDGAGRSEKSESGIYAEVKTQSVFVLAVSLCLSVSLRSLYSLCLVWLIEVKNKKKKMSGERAKFRRSPHCTRESRKLLQAHNNTRQNTITQSAKSRGKPSILFCFHHFLFFISLSFFFLLSFIMAAAFCFGLPCLCLACPCLALPCPPVLALLRTYFQSPQYRRRCGLEEKCREDKHNFHCVPETTDCRFHTYPARVTSCLEATNRVRKEKLQDKCQRGARGLQLLQGCKRCRELAEGKRPTQFMTLLQTPEILFDLQGNRKQKHYVLGRKTKGAVRNVALAKKRDAEQREATLRPMLDSDGKANTFEDKRFGEGQDISEEEKDLMRFKKIQADRFNPSRGKRNFNIEDDDEGDGSGSLSNAAPGFELTHGGKPLNELRNMQFDEVDSRMQENAEYDGLGAEIVEQLHFGGGAGTSSNSDVKKTREEIYAELISKSKKFRAERAKQKAQDDVEMDRLDDALDDIRGLLSFQPSKPSKKDELKDMMRRVLGDGADSSSKAKDGKEQPKAKKGAGKVVDDDDDDFEKLARSMLYEARAQATDRTKTEEEKAKEEHARLRKLEKERVERMTADTSIPAPKRAVTDDDLGTNYVIDPAFSQIYSDESDEEGSPILSDSDSDEGRQSRSRSASKFGSDDDSDGEDGFDKDEHSKGKTGDHSEASTDEMPFIVPCPRSLREMQSMVQRWVSVGTDAKARKDAMTVLLSRIRKSNSIHLHADNRAKLSKFCRILLRLVCTEASATALYEYIGDPCAKELFALSQIFPKASGDAFREELSSLRKRCLLEVQAKDALRCWPKIGELLALRIMLSVFPTSDYR